MEPIINISQINDFLYCPKSLYLHSIYTAFDTKVFHEAAQVVGGFAHENIESGKYSTSTHVLQGLSVFSHRLGIKGKIDVYDAKNHHLIERKYRVKQIYKGFRFQLYAQMYCLEEAGYTVSRLSIHSLSDNKRYEVTLPSSDVKKDFEKTIRKMRRFSPQMLQEHSCSRCTNNIYSLLAW